MARPDRRYAPMGCSTAPWYARLSLWEDARKGSATDQERDQANRGADRAVESSPAGYRGRVLRPRSDPRRTRPWTRSATGPTSRRWSRTWRSGSRHFAARPRLPAKSEGKPAGPGLAGRAGLPGRRSHLAVVLAVGLIRWDRDHRPEARATMDELGAVLRAAPG